MTDEQIRVGAMLDRLDGLVADAERYAFDAYNRDEIDNAGEWFALASKLSVARKELAP